MNVDFNFAMKGLALSVIDYLGAETPTERTAAKGDLATEAGRLVDVLHRMEREDLDRIRKNITGVLANLEDIER